MTSAALKTAIAVAMLELVSVAGYAFSIVISYLTTGSHGTTGSDVSPWILTVVYLAFAALIGLIVRGLVKGKGSARTPYLVTQAFAVVVAQALISGSEDSEKLIGWALVAIALAGSISILRPSASKGLNVHR